MRSSLRHTAILFGCCFGILAQPAVADTNLFANGVWIVQGATDPATNAAGITVSIGGVPAGVFSEVKIFHTFTGAGVPQIFSIKGRGALQPILPPPGEPGGAFYLTGYIDCVDGLIPQLLITALDLKTKGNTSKSLTFNGRVTNLSSMNADNFKLKLLNPSFDEVAAQVSYTLLATRDFCVDQSAQSEGRGFPAAQIASNFISDTVNDNDLLRYYTVLDKYCDCCGCYKAKGWVCGDLAGPDRVLVCFADVLSKPPLMLVHQNNLPADTPTLVAEFKKPAPKKINPQGFAVETVDPATENVNVWGNWYDAKPSYDAGKKVGKFQFTLKALTPGTYFCDVPACYPD